ncbi:uncharacterized protein LOC144121307 [Amblyomma americanum]
MLILLWLMVLAGRIPCPVKSQGLPFYNGSFYACGEVTRHDFYIKGRYFGKELTVVKEVFDSKGKKTALQITKKDDVITYLYDMKVKKMFLLRTQGGAMTTCEDVAPPVRWNPRIMSDILHAQDGRDYMPLRNMLVLRSKLKKMSREEDLTRGIYTMVFSGRSEDNVGAVLKWTLNREYVPKDYYDYNGDMGSPATTTQRTAPVPDPPISSYLWPPKRFLDVNSAMSAPLNSTPPIFWEGSLRMVQAGSYVEPTITTRVFDFDYIKHPIHHDLLQIPDGVRCGGYWNPDLRRPIYSALRQFSFSAVTWTNKKKHHRRISGWVDANQQLYRLDYTPWSGGRASKYHTLIISGREDAAYKIPHETGRPCQLMPIKQISFDPQMIIDPQEVKKLTAKTFFTGPDQTKSLDYKKPAFRAGIPCHIWDVVREDWPPGTSHVKTLWEWCFVDMTKYSNEEKTLQVISLDIHVLEAPDGLAQDAEDLAAGDTYFFRFFHFNKTSPGAVEITSFFTNRCYPRSNWMKVRFTVNETIPAEVLRDPAFKAAALKKTGSIARIPVPALRVGRIKTYNTQTNARIETVLLDRFPNSTYAPGSINISESIKKIQYNIGRKTFSIEFKRKSYLIIDMCKLDR